MEAYPKGMFGFRLPPGYRVQVGPDVLILRRADGLMVAAFIAPGVDPVEVEREAAEDYRLERRSRERITTFAPQGLQAQSVGEVPRFA
jgi:hypothetical protein